jgi:hypothetical protein
MIVGPWTTRAWIIRIAAIAVIVGAVAILTSGGDDSATQATPSAPDPEAMAQFQQCLSEHGVEAPDAAQGPPSGDPSQGSGPSKKMLRAMQACSRYAPQGGQGGFPDGAPPSGVPAAPSS